MRLAISFALLCSLALVWGAPAQAQAKVRITAVPSRVSADRSPPGREGNVEWLRWSLRDRYDREIGHAYFNCRWAQRFIRLCYGIFQMPLGTIATLGSSATRENGTYSVVGGTGEYVSSGGEMSWFATSIRRLSVVIELE